MAKKDMLTPHSNIQYGAVIVIILVCIAMIVVPIWQHTRKLAVASLNYNQTVTLGDYYVMFNNAAYDSEQKKFVCDMYIKCKKPGTSDTAPTIYSVASSENLDEFKKYELSALPNEYGQTLTVLGVPSEAQYVRVYLESITPEYKLPDKTDAFGNIIEGEVVPAVNRYLEVVINLSGLAQSQGAVSTDFNTETEATEISQTTLDTSEKFPEPSEPSKTTISTTETTISEQTTSVTTTTTTKKPTTTTTTTTKKPMITTTKKPATTTTTTTKAKTTTTAKKTTTTTTTTTAKKPTTTTTTTKKVDEPPKDGVVMYSNGVALRKQQRRTAKILIEEIKPNEKITVVGDIIVNDSREWYYAYYDGMYGYVLANGVNRLPVERCDEEICILINELRKSLGLNELRIDEELMEMATVRSAEENLPTTSPHVRPDGSSFSTILDEYGWEFFKDYYTAGEIQCSGTESARLAVEGWKLSEGHYNNMIGNYTAMGAGRADDGFWVVLFVRETKE